MRVVDSPGWYYVDLGVDVRLRALGLSVQSGCCIASVIGNVEPFGSTGVQVFLSIADGDASGVTLTDRPFSIVVY